MGFFDDFASTADSILGVAERGASIYQQFAGTGGNRNDGSLPQVQPVPPAAAADGGGMSTLTIVALVAGAVLVGWLLLRKRG